MKRIWIASSLFVSLTQMPNVFADIALPGGPKRGEVVVSGSTNSTLQIVVVSVCVCAIIAIFLLRRNTAGHTKDTAKEPDDKA